MRHGKQFPTLLIFFLLDLKISSLKDASDQGQKHPHQKLYFHKNAGDLLLLLGRFSCVQLCATLWTAASQALLSMGFSRQEYWRELPCPLPGDLPNPGIEPASPALQADSLLLRHWEASNTSKPPC